MRSSQLPGRLGKALCAYIAAGMLAASPWGAVAAERVWQAGQGLRWSALGGPGGGQTGFSCLPATQTGLTFTNSVDELSGAANRVRYNGSGVAVGDVDNDGLPDIFLCNLNGHNALFKNLGSWRFREVTAEAGLVGPYVWTRGAVFADIDGDGDLDLLISVSGRGVLCFLNDGRGRFTDATAVAGTASPYGSTSMTLADIDGNGTLDLYVANYRPDDIRDRGRVSVKMVNGRPVMAGTETNRFVMMMGRLEECGQPDQLFLNDGAGRFRLASWTDGTFLDEAGRPLSEAPADWGLTAAFRDVNGDSAPDLYVCNDYWTPDRFWINDGRGHFRAIAKQALRKTSASSMSVAFSDINRDGCLDFFVVDMLSRYPQLRKREDFAQMHAITPVGVLDDRPQVMRNTLFLGRPDGSYGEIAYYANLPASDWSWAPVFLDVDLDGYDDLIIGAGHFRDVQDYDAEVQVRARQHSWEGFKNDVDRQAAFTRELLENYRLYPLLQMPIGAFRNRRDCSFEETTETWGLNQLGVHQGIALADFDGDGDLDMVVNNLNSAAALYRNDATGGRVAVRLRGKAPNTQGIGAKVALLGGPVTHLSTEVMCGGHYQSGSETAAMFATGGAHGPLALEVLWRNGTRSLVTNVLPNCLYEIDEQGAQPAPRRSVPVEVPLFEDVSERIAHRHHETDFNDYERQPLLPFKLSQLGPGVAWFDTDGDGHDDLIVGAGRGGSLAVFHGDGRGRFQLLTNDPPFALPQDSSGMVGWDHGDRSILVGLTGYEAPSDHAAMAFGVTNSRCQSGASLAKEIPNGGALALADLSGNGRWVLFVAGGVLPGQYPMGAPSKLYRFDGHEWRLDVKNSSALDRLGIVNGALWSDLDGDGVPELVLACEWGPVRVFRVRNDALFDVTAEWGLSAYTGWWRGIASVDLNGDGRLDLVAANWGLNSPYRASAQQPLTFVYGQLAQPGVTEVIETEYVGGTLAPRRQFRALVNSMPFLYEKLTTHKAYSEANLDEVLGDRAVLAQRVTATTLASMMFLNTGQGFKAVELPVEAQLAPAFAVCAADFDGDGNEDVFLSQNFFATHPETTRIDAGLGLWLKGDGAGHLAPVPVSRSGVQVYGEQRGAAVADFDEDGRPDLVVTQNGAATRLFRNAGATPGLRVRLRGTAGNPRGVGAVLRLQLQDRLGPAREVHAGSGYWSQDSLTPVLGMPTQASELRVRWPGGKETVTPVPPNARELVVDYGGQRGAP